MNTLDGGRMVGRYRIERFLGAGAMGEVYLAEDPQIERRLAIKTVRLVGRPQEIEERRKRLLREARAAGRLLHPNIVTLFDAGEAEGLVFLAFEFVEGTDLAVRLEPGKQRLSLREVLRIVRQAADALDYAHGQGIVHRDIKPSNILLDRLGRVKVADFGIAKMAGQSTELTMAGSVMGSPQYLSPEQIRGEDLDGRSDIFSLGVVLYELLSGKRPFDGDTITTLVYQILHKEPPPVSELRAVPPQLESLLTLMLAKDRDGRIASAGEVAKTLGLIEMELADETLSAPAGTGPMDATFILPPKATGAASAAVPPPPPPALGTVPASPATTPSIPPPPAYVPTAQHPAAPPAPAPVAAAAPAPPGRSRSVLPVIAAVMVLLLVAMSAVGWYAFSRFQAWRSAAEVAPRPGETETTAAPAEGAPAEPMRTAEVPEDAPQLQPEAPPPAGPERAQEFRPTAMPPVQPPPAREPVSPPPPGPQEKPRERVFRPAEEPAPAPVPREPEPEPEPEPAPREAEPPPAPVPAADQTIRTGLQVNFRISPSDAHVLVDGRVIGTAQEWSGQKGARTYTFPGAGTYLVKIRKPGLKERRIAVQVTETGGTTPILARLQSMEAAEVDASDLRTVRVRQAVAFRVTPPSADVLVDGRSMGPARRYSGGGVLRARGEWLELAPGKHRVSLVAPGFRQQDIIVEVSETADQERERIELTLTPSG